MHRNSTQAEHAARIAAIRQVTAASGRQVSILLDLQGPKIRLGYRFADGGAARFLEAGGTFTITAEPILGDSRRASATYPNLAADVRPGAPVCCWPMAPSN